MLAPISAVDAISNAFSGMAGLSLIPRCFELARIYTAALGTGIAQGIICSSLPHAVRVSILLKAVQTLTLTRVGLNLYAWQSQIPALLVYGMIICSLACGHYCYTQQWLFLQGKDPDPLALSLQSMLNFFRQQLDPIFTADEDHTFHW